MRIIDKIRHRENLTPTEHTLALFLQEHSKEATTMSLNELSTTLHASKSSIIRFCKKLGYKGHKELCVQLAKELDTFTFNDKELDASVPFEANDDKNTIAQKTYVLTSTALHETWQDIDVECLYRVSKNIHDKKNVYIYAGEDGYTLASDFANKLETIGIHVHLKAVAGTSLKQACMQEIDSIALFIYYHLKTDELIRAAQILANKKVPIIIVTGPEKGTLTKYATETISVAYYENTLKIGAFGSFVAMQLILNMIYAYMFQMDYDKNMNTIKALEENRKKYVSMKQ